MVLVNEDDVFTADAHFGIGEVRLRAVRFPSGKFLGSTYKDAESAEAFARREERARDAARTSLTGATFEPKGGVRTIVRQAAVVLGRRSDIPECLGNKAFRGCGGRAAASLGSAGRR